MVADKDGAVLTHCCGAVVRLVSGESGREMLRTFLTGRDPKRLSAPSEQNQFQFVLGWLARTVSGVSAH